MSSDALTYHALDGLWKRRGSVPSAPPPVEPITLLDVNFNDWALHNKGTITQSYWNTRMGGGASSNGVNQEDLSIVSVAGQGNVCRCFLQANTIRSNPAGNHGVVMVIPLAQQVLEATMTYDIRFVGANHHFGWGGKLPGLAGVAPGVSLSWPSGGKFGGDDGWSVRQMWATAGAYSGSVGQRINRGLSYYYGKDQVGQYGDNLWYSTATSTTESFSRDTVHRVSMYLKMNDPLQSNGIIRTSVDGTVVYETTSKRFRSRDDVRIGLIYFDIFRGGAELTWAAPTDENVDIDNIKITSP